MITFLFISMHCDSYFSIEIVQKFEWFETVVTGKPMIVEY